VTNNVLVKSSPSSESMDLGKIKFQISGIDLFCGVGGLTHGLVNGGIEITAGVDIDSNCKFPYTTNNRALFIEKDLRALTSNDIIPLYKKNTLRLLAGCAPCQPFSTYNRGNKIAVKNDRKWDLLLDFGRLAQEIQPDFVTMENVPQLVSHSVFTRFCEYLAGYYIWHQVIDCVDYGVPQTRKRLVLLASKHGPIQLIPPTHANGKQRSVHDVISMLPRISAGESYASDPLHTSSALSDTNLQRIKMSKPGGSWRDWPAELRAKCHLKNSGKTYPSVYGRMDWNLPAPTITTQCFGFGNGRFGHPDQDRAISLREAAIIQTFPIDYQFIPSGSPVRFNVLGRLIGNAVPVRVGEVISQSFHEHVLQVFH